VLPLRRLDLRDGVLHVVRTAHEGEILQGTKTDHGEASPGRVVPCPPGLLRAMPVRIDTELLFPTPRGLLWRERNFYRDVWYPAQERSGLDVRPHEMQHSYVSHLRAAGSSAERRGRTHAEIPLGASNNREATEPKVRGSNPLGRASLPSLVPGGFWNNASKTTNRRLRSRRRHRVLRRHRHRLRLHHRGRASGWRPASGRACGSERGRA
jgi:hypothetical protein